MLLLCKKMKAQEFKERICLLFEEFLALEVIHMKFGFSSKIFSNKCSMWRRSCPAVSADLHFAASVFFSIT